MEKRSLTGPKAHIKCEKIPQEQLWWETGTAPPGRDRLWARKPFIAPVAASIFCPATLKRRAPSGPAFPCRPPLPRRKRKRACATFDAELRVNLSLRGEAVEEATLNVGKEWTEYTVNFTTDNNRNINLKFMVSFEGRSKKDALCLDDVVVRVKPK